MLMSVPWRSCSGRESQNARPGAMKYLHVHVCVERPKSRVQPLQQHTRGLRSVHARDGPELDILRIRLLVGKPRDPRALGVPCRHQGEACTSYQSVQLTFHKSVQLFVTSASSCTP